MSAVFESSADVMGAPARPLLMTFCSVASTVVPTRIAVRRDGPRERVALGLHEGDGRRGALPEDVHRDAGLPVGVLVEHARIARARRDGVARGGPPPADRAVELRRAPRLRRAAAARRERHGIQVRGRHHDVRNLERRRVENARPGARGVRMACARREGHQLVRRVIGDLHRGVDAHQDRHGSERPDGEHAAEPNEAGVRADERLLDVVRARRRRCARLVEIGRGVLRGTRRRRAARVPSAR